MQHFSTSLKSPAIYRMTTPVTALPIVMEHPLEMLGHIAEKGLHVPQGTLAEQDIVYDAIVKGFSVVHIYK